VAPATNNRIEAVTNIAVRSMFGCERLHAHQVPRFWNTPRPQVEAIDGPNTASGVPSRNPNVLRRKSRTPARARLGASTPADAPVITAAPRCRADLRIGTVLGRYLPTPAA
jgi:hypothetical protein